MWSSRARLLYGLHGYIPYDTLSDPTDAYQRYRFTSAVRAVFENWFLLVYAWHAKNNIAADQLPNLLKHFHRARLAVPGQPEHQAVQRIRDAVKAADSDWLTGKPQLPTMCSALFSDRAGASGSPSGQGCADTSAYGLSIGHQR